MIKCKSVFFSLAISCSVFFAAHAHSLDGTFFSKVYRVLEGVFTSGPVVVIEPAPVCPTCVNGQFSTIIVADPDINEGNNKDAILNYQFESAGQDVKTGRYVDGGVWVMPATGQTEVTFNVVTGSHEVSASINPQIEDYGIGSGLRRYGHYNSSKDIVPQLPMTFTTDVSILVAMLRDEAAQSKCGTSGIVGECIDAYEVVNIVMQEPVADALRPPLTTTTKVSHRMSDFDFSRIALRPEFTGTNSAGFESIRRKWAHSTEIFGSWDSDGKWPCEGSRCFRSHILVPNYAGQTSQSYHSDWATLRADTTPVTDPAKQAAIAAMIVYGQDIYHNHFTTDQDRYLGSGAGQWLGKHQPMLNYVNMLIPTGPFSDYRLQMADLINHVDDIPDAGPQEIDQMNPGPNGPTWGDDGTPKAYWADLLGAKCHANAVGNCNTNEGSKAEKDPTGQIDGPAPKPGGGYQQIGWGNKIASVATMCSTPGMGDLVNYDGLVQYVDRLNASNVKTSPDTCAAPSPSDVANPLCNPFKIQLDSPGTASGYQAVTGCFDIGELWGPDPADPQNSCIAVSPSNPKSRFEGVEHSVLKPQNTTAQIMANYDALRGTTTNCRI